MQKIANVSNLRFLFSRNCILSSENSVVKITDVAMGIPAFNEDYVELQGNGGRLAPIRWQAWETTVLVSSNKIIH